jgi:hypothetical protein
MDVTRKFVYVDGCLPQRFTPHSAFFQPLLQGRIRLLLRDRLLRSPK